MLKQATSAVMPGFAGPIALRDKLAHIPHRRLNPEILVASVALAEVEVLPLIQVRTANLSR